MLKLALAAALLLGQHGHAARYGFSEVAHGFAAPTYVTSAPNDPSTLYVVEQRGTVQVVGGGTWLDLRGVVQADGGERGLLSLAFSPRYAQNGLFYVDYTDAGGDIRVVEYHAVDGVPDLASARSLLDVAHPWPNHNGGQLQFDRNGLLYVGTGDGGTDPAGSPTQPGDPHDNAQSTTSQLGKILRIDPSHAEAGWRLVALGLRNPWRFSFDRATGDLWIGDVGAATKEEIDHRPRALVGTVANYGWSRFEGPLTYKPQIRLSRAGRYVAPTYSYSHNGGVECAVIGGYVYRGSVAAARGRYFFGDLCSGSVWSFAVGKKRLSVVRLAQRIPALTSFGETPDGTLYAVDADGTLWRLTAGG